MGPVIHLSAVWDGESARLCHASFPCPRRLNKNSRTYYDIVRRFAGFRVETFATMSSSPCTTVDIGVENSRQIRSKVRRVIGFPASTFCQYRTENPWESMSS